MFYTSLKIIGVFCAERTLSMLAERAGVLAQPAVRGSQFHHSGAGVLSTSTGSGSQTNNNQVGGDNNIQNNGTVNIYNGLS